MIEQNHQDGALEGAAKKIGLTLGLVDSQIGGPLKDLTAQVNNSIAKIQSGARRLFEQATGIRVDDLFSQPPARQALEDGASGNGQTGDSSAGGAGGEPGRGQAALFDATQSTSGNEFLPFVLAAATLKAKVDSQAAPDGTITRRDFLDLAPTAATVMGLATLIKLVFGTAPSSGRGPVAPQPMGGIGLGNGKDTRPPLGIPIDDGQAVQPTRAPQPISTPNGNGSTAKADKMPPAPATATATRQPEATVTRVVGLPVMEWPPIVKKEIDEGIVFIRSYSDTTPLYRAMLDREGKSSPEKWIGIRARWKNLSDGTATLETTAEKSPTIDYPGRETVTIPIRGGIRLLDYLGPAGLIELRPDQFNSGDTVDVVVAWPSNEIYGIARIGRAKK